MKEGRRIGKAGHHVRRLAGILAIAVLATGETHGADHAPRLAAATDPPPSPGERPGPEASAPRRRVGLALSGGGARGIAHIGVLEALEAMHVPIECVAGTSMGSIVGGVYATGLAPEEIEQRLLGLDWTDLFDDRPARRGISYRRKQDNAGGFFDFELGFVGGRLVLPGGLIAGQKIGFAFAETTLHAFDVTDFDRLPIPYRAVATDVSTGDMVVLSGGSLPRAMRASMAVPGVFAPVEVDGRLLVDGGLVRNLPVDVVRTMGCDTVIAVDVGRSLVEKTATATLSSITKQVSSIITRKNVEAQLPQADVVVSVPLGGASAGDFSRAKETIRAGRDAVNTAGPQLARLAVPPEAFESWRNRVRRSAGSPPAIDAVRIEGLDRVDPRIVGRRLRVRPGDVLDLERLRADLQRIYELGDFESLEFELARDGGKTTLVVRAREKRWGPHYLRVGAELSYDFEGDTSFAAKARVTSTRLDPLGAEWRTDLQIGDRRLLATEFYQPVDWYGRSFVVPTLRYQDGLREVFENGERIADYQAKIASGQLETGVNIGHSAELRLGILRGRARAHPEVGAPDLPRYDISIAGLTGRLSYDALDNMDFPRRGEAGAVEYYTSRRSLGADLSYRRAVGGLGGFWTRGRTTAFLQGSAGTDLGSELPFYDQFTLGGLLSLSGFRPGELTGPIFGVARAGAYRRTRRAAGLIGRGAYFGGWIEAGNAWPSSTTIDAQSLRWTGTLAFGVDSALGPLYLAAGRAEGGRSAVYLVLGRQIGGPLGQAAP